MLWWETSIADEVLHNLSQMHKQGRKSLWYHHPAPYCPHPVISLKVESQIAYKIPDLGYSISTESGMLWCQDRHPLLLKYLTIFLPCMRNAPFEVVYWLGELLKAFISHLWATRRDFSLCWFSRCTQNARFGVPSQQGEWDNMLQWETSIAAEVFHILPWIYE